MQKAFKTSPAFFIITQKSNIVFHPYVCYHVCQKIKLVVGWNIRTKNIDITHLRASITPLNTCWLRKKIITLRSICFQIHIISNIDVCQKKNYEHNTRSIYEKQRSKEYMHFLKKPTLSDDLTMSSYSKKEKLAAWVASTCFLSKTITYLIHNRCKYQFVLQLLKLTSYFNFSISQLFKRLKG